MCMVNNIPESEPKYVAYDSQTLSCSIKIAHTWDLEPEVNAS